MSSLIHVSEDGSIGRFEPRCPPTGGDPTLPPVVWAIDHQHLPNYLLPRDCPRVTFYARPDSCPEDVERLIGASAVTRVVAIEAGWFERALTTPLYLYELPPANFRPLDAGAGYYVSEVPVVPLAVRRVASPLRELLHRNAELRVVPSLWPLRDAVIASSLQYSCIRLRNAQPRPDA